MPQRLRKVSWNIPSFIDDEARERFETHEAHFRREWNKFPQNTKIKFHGRTMYHWQYQNILWAEMQRVIKEVSDGPQPLVSEIYEDEAPQPQTTKAPRVEKPAPRKMPDIVGAAEETLKAQRKAAEESAKKLSDAFGGLPG